MTARKTLILTAMLAVLLSGCDKLSDQLKNGATAADGLVTSGSTQNQSKLSAYTLAYNKLLETFGLTETAERYFKEDIASKSPSDNISVTDGWLEQAHTLLVKARAMPGGPADLDQSADKLIAALATAMKRLDGLKVYYDSKAYKEDGLKRGKAEDAAMTAEFHAALAAMKSLSDVIDRERRVETIADLAKMKSKGDLLGYDAKLSLQQSEELIALFRGDEAELSDPALIAKGDTQIVVLEKTLADLRTEIAKAKAAPGSKVDIHYEMLASQLTSLVGDYRDMKQSHDVDDFNNMVDYYNRAVDYSNDISA